MKTMWIRVFLIFAFGAVFTACSDRKSEKKIAELESRLAELEGKKTAGPSAGPSTTTVPSPATEPIADAKPEGPLPKLEFAKVDHDFGTISEGEVVEYTYSFKNTGEAPLIIQSAQGSCGCTVPDWSKQPVPVGGTGFVKAKFNSKGFSNIQNKTVTVTANTWPKQTVLRFKALVTKADAAPAEGPVRK